LIFFIQMFPCSVEEQFQLIPLTMGDDSKFSPKRVLRLSDFYTS
jgi:hypothetical protein